MVEETVPSHGLLPGPWQGARTYAEGISLFAFMKIPGRLVPRHHMQKIWCAWLVLVLRVMTHGSAVLTSVSPFAGFLTETGKTRASTIFSTGTESAFQVTQIRIMVILILTSLSNVTAIFKDRVPFQSLCPWFALHVW